MSNVYDYMWLIPVLPAVGAVIIALFGPRFLKNQSHWPCVLSVAASALLSFGVFSAVHSEGLPQVEEKPVHSHSYGTWFKIGPLDEAVRQQTRADRPLQVDVD